MQTQVEHLCQAAKNASYELAKVSSHTKRQALLALAELLASRETEILKENDKDVLAATKQGLDSAFIDRLRMNPNSIRQMIQGVKEIAAMDDPVGGITDMRSLPSGIQVGKMRVPLGVVAIIYEARPNVTIDAAALCIQSGNACILRGGREAQYSNQILAELCQQALITAGLPAQVCQALSTSDREYLRLLVKQHQYIDVVIPRGGKNLVQFLMQESTIPQLMHLDGICHIYVDAAADLNKALPICDNAKTQRYAPCNTMETLLVHESIAALFLPQLAQIYQQKSVEIRGCERVCELLNSQGFQVLKATEADWSTEYLAPIIAIKIVSDFDEAVRHINHYGSKHTDAILTENYTLAMRFLREVDSGSVMINASTRFADGFEYGLGAEIGIATGKLHARGPVGVVELTSQKYVVFGHGEIRQ